MPSLAYFLPFFFDRQEKWRIAGPGSLKLHTGPCTVEKVRPAFRWHAKRNIRLCPAVEPYEDLPMQDEFPVRVRANPASTARIGGHPIHPMLVPVPVACFVGTLLTDLVYWKTAEMMWADFSAWLLFAGLVMGLLAALVGLIDFLSNRLIRALAPAWLHMAGNFVVLVLAFFNALVHSRDAWTSVVPTGLVLSALTVTVLLFTGWMGWTMVYRHRVGVSNRAQNV